MPSSSNSEQVKIEFPAEIIISKRKSKKTGKFFEHWYFTVPTTVRKLINRDNKVMKVTLERILPQD